MNLIAYLKCPNCYRLPRPNCQICNGLGGTYSEVEYISLEQEILNQSQINSLEIQIQKAIKIPIWPPKLKLYFINSISFLEQYNFIYKVQILTLKINRNIKFQYLSELKSILVELKARPVLEFILGIGNGYRISGENVSYLEQTDMLRISLFSENIPILKPRLRMIDLSEKLKSSSKYILTNKRKLVFQDSSVDYKELDPGLWAALKYSANFSVEYFFILKSNFDKILKSF